MSATFRLGGETLQLCVMTTDSMAPALRTGDLVLVRPVPAAELTPGDVILLPHRGPGPNKLHRLVGFETHGGRRCIATKGDNELLADLWDEPVAVEDVLGRLAYVRKASGDWLEPGPGAYALSAAASALAAPRSLPPRWRRLLNDAAGRLLALGLRRRARLVEALPGAEPAA